MNATWSIGRALSPKTLMLPPGLIPAMLMVKNCTSGAAAARPVTPGLMGVAVGAAQDVSKKTISRKRVSLSRTRILHGDYMDRILPLKKQRRRAASLQNCMSLLNSEG